MASFPWRAAGLLVLGGSLGTLARFGVSMLLARPGFPWNVLLVNVLGSLAIGVMLGRGATEDTRLLVAVGFLGAFTTMSAFAYDTVALARGGEPGLALANGILNPAASVAAAGLGVLVGRTLTA